jgi:hypothetical protein
MTYGIAFIYDYDRNCILLATYIFTINYQ